MNTRVLLVLLAFMGFILTVCCNHCCPEPNNRTKCGCCPEACCCMCRTVQVQAPAPTTLAPSTVCQTGGLDICFIVDTSASVRDTGWAMIMNFIADFVARFDNIGTETRVALVRYGTDDPADLVWDLSSSNTDSLATLQGTLRNLSYVRMLTNTGAGLHQATVNVFGGVNGDRDDTLYPDVAIVLADGNTNEGELQLPARAAALQAVTSLVYCIGITHHVDFSELNLIADGTNNASVTWMENFSDLQQQVLVNELDTHMKGQICRQIAADAQATRTVSVEDCKCCCPPKPVDPSNPWKTKPAKK